MWKTCLLEREGRDPGHLPLPKKWQSISVQKNFAQHGPKSLPQMTKAPIIIKKCGWKKLKKNLWTRTQIMAESLQDAERQKMENTVKNCGND